MNFLTKIFNSSEKKIVERLNRKIKQLEKDLVIYKRYHSVYEERNTEKLLKELKYIKNGKE